MKSLKLSLFTFCAILCLSSCSKDASPVPVVPSIVGSWKIITTSYTDCTQSINNRTTDYSVVNLVYVFSGTSTSGTYTYGGNN